jgi:hypothetical protein
MSRTEIMKWIEYKVGSALLCDENPMDHWEPAEEPKKKKWFQNRIPNFFNIREWKLKPFHSIILTSIHPISFILSQWGREMMPKSMHNKSGTNGWKIKWNGTNGCKD